MLKTTRDFSEFVKIHHRNLVFALTAMLSGFCVANSAKAAIVGPYTADANTLHLWHLNEAHPGPAAPASGVVGSFNLTPTNSATLGAAGFVGFGTAGDTSGLQSNGFQGAVIPVSAVTGANGAFTYEALVRTANISDSQMIVGMDNNSSNIDRPFQFRMVGGNLLFTNIGSVIQALSSPIPTTGPDAFVANQWYHVAVAYDGIENTANNLKFYWTRADESRTRAGAIFAGNMAADLSGISTTLGVGNDYRTAGTGNTSNVEGLIDEPRISNIARSGDDFLFAKSLGGKLLLADNFNTGSTGLNDDLGSRQSGILATTPYSNSGSGTVAVAANKLRFDNTATGSLVISPNFDFATGPTVAAIEAHGGFTIDFDVNPVADGNDGTSNNWFAVSLGHTAASVTGGGQPVVTNANADIGILFRDNGLFSFFDNGTNSFAGTFDVTPSGGEFYNIHLRVQTDSAASGGGMLSAFVNGVQLDLGGTGLNYAFTWDGDGTNYLAFESRTDDAVFDNLYIAAFVPEPSSYALLAVSLLGLVGAARWRSRRSLKE